MGRADKYETHVKPRLAEITELRRTHTERQIAGLLGVSKASFENYKKLHPELKEALKKGTERLVDELKETLIKKARGFYYEETKTTVIQSGDSETIKEETFRRYALPDTGAAHILLKNLDPEWRNDDMTTVKLKQEKLEIEKNKDW